MRFNHQADQVQGVDTVTDEDAVLVLAPDADAPAIARVFVAAHHDHLPAHLVDDAQLLVSELVTNAVQHGRAAIVLRVRSEPPGIGVAVADSGAPVPDHAVEDPTQPDPEATRGRGLAIVDAIADAWGVEPTQPPPGKTIWFELRAE